MHGMVGKRKSKSNGSAKDGRPNGRAGSRAVAPAADDPLLLKITPRLDRGLTRLAAKTGKPKHYHLRRALERYIEDTWDYLEAAEALKTTRRTYSLEEVKKRLGVDS